MPFGDLRAGAKKHGHTVNDGFLPPFRLACGTTTTSSALPLMNCTSTCPLHAQQRRITQNAVSIARFDLPTNFTDINKLMDSLGATVKKLRAEPTLDYANQLGEISRFLPTELLTQAAQASDVTASNVPGPPFQSIWLAKVEAMIPDAAAYRRCGFAALLSYAGTASIGVAMDDAAITDRDLLAKSFARGFAKVTGKPVGAMRTWFTGVGMKSASTV